ncbi:MAG: alpha/beta fold hydrolase [Bacteroidota bacterium]
MIIDNSTYKPHLLFKRSHFNTVYRTLFDQIEINFKRKRLETNDGDFLDLDFSISNSNKIAIVIHGLEGSSSSSYIKSVTRVLNLNKIDVVAINLRGCSGESNRLISSYHSGKTDDLAAVISYIDKQYNYDDYFIVGFSLGGNLILKYLGENGYEIPVKIRSAVTISVPCDLKGSSETLSKFWNFIYIQRFIRSLKQKTFVKLQQFPNSFLIKEEIEKVKSLYDFDNLYTAPAHGFKDAYDYWEKNSSKQFITNIKVPTLLITAIDDPFLSNSCFPVKEAKLNSNFYLELPKYGGHVGFNSTFSKTNDLWLENRVAQFLENLH